MSRYLVLLVSLATGQLSIGQSPTTAPQPLPKDPHAILAAAEPFYDFSDPSLKPWHLKATYQLYDEKGKPAEQGTYEYWWASPKIYRGTWTRPHAAHTEWHTADGRYERLDSGGPLKFFERRLESMLLAPLAGMRDPDPALFGLELKLMPAGGADFPCITEMPLRQRDGTLQPLPESLAQSFCFDPQMPILWAIHSNGIVTVDFSSIVKAQGKYLPRGVLVTGGKQKIFSASVNQVSGLSLSDPALTPSPDARLAMDENTGASAGLSGGWIIKRVPPVYPQMAWSGHDQGTVLLQGTIGVDGLVHNPEVILAPSRPLAESALDAVSQWVYKPFLLNGKPIEKQTVFNVRYSFTK